MSEGIITEADMNEKRMCADCLGCGSVDNHTCVYCKGSGRVLTYRAVSMRQLRQERLANAAPALYEALKNLLNCRWVAETVSTRVTEARAAIALADNPTATEASNEQPTTS